MSDLAMSHLSDLLIYSSMAVYTAAFLGFVTDLSGRGKRVGAAAVAAHAVTLPAATQPVLAGLAGLAGRGGASAPADPVGSTIEAGAVRQTPRGLGGSPGKGARDEGPESRAMGIAISLTYLAFGLHVAGVVARGLAVHRAPWGNMYEFSITGTAIVTGVFLIVLLRRDLRFLGTFIIGPVLLSLGLAITVLYTQAGPLLPALQSFWLIIHVSVAFIASALFTIGFSLTLIQLVQDRREKQLTRGEPARGGRFMEALPTSVELEASAYRIHAIAFPLWSFTLIAGAIWAEKAWSSYWSWDPKEVWSFVIWVVYAAYLHARATRGWTGRRAAYLALAGYACILFNYLVVNFYFIGLHAYSGVK